MRAWLQTVRRSNNGFSGMSVSGPHNMKESDCTVGDVKLPDMRKGYG